MRKKVLGVLALTGAIVSLYVGFLYLTHNFHVVIPGMAYRSAQPSAENIASWHKTFGIRTIINLRGAHPNEGLSLIHI